MTAEAVDKTIQYFDVEVPKDLDSNGFPELGAMLKSYNDNAPRANPEIEKKLEELEAKIDENTEKLQDCFTNLKSFVTGSNFYGDVMLPTSKLTRYMANCVGHPGPDAWNNFQEAYEKNKPLELGNMVASLINENPSKTNIMFLGSMNAILTHLLLLEDFAHGYLKEGSAPNSQKTSTIEQWRANIKIDD